MVRPFITCSDNIDRLNAKMKSRHNPYTSPLKTEGTIRLGGDNLEYFKGLAEETGIPYQSLIHLYLRDLRDWMAKNHKLDLS